MNLSKIHHIAIIVSDYKAAKDFYVNKLGFSVIRENYRPERKDWKLDLRVNEHTELEIFAEENPPKRVNRPEACGLRHLAFCVDSVEQTVNELAEVGYPTESNESAYCIGVRKIITQLEIYDQVWVARKIEESVQKENGGVRHSRKGIKLAGKIVRYLEENEGTAECFPYDEIEEMRGAFWL